MSILVLDDCPHRMIEFRRGLVGASVTTLSTAKEALAWLKDHTPKVICLDYDLHENGRSRQEAGSGGDVATFIVQNDKRFKKTKVIIHSLNKTGSQRMFLLLQRHNIDVQKHPFLWDDAQAMALMVLSLRDSA